MESAGEAELVAHRLRSSLEHFLESLLVFGQLSEYRFDPDTGLWRHRHGPPSPQITLHEVTYGRVGEEAYPGYLRQARAVLAALPGHIEDGPTGLSPEFEALRWFPLPPACLPAQSGDAAGWR